MLQGLTLEEVIIDFREDKEKKIKNFLQFGSFYVALTRVRNGNHVFLKGFDKSYIVENKNIATKLDAFKKFNCYKPKKVYLDENIFEDSNSETMVGYLNINGLMSANHAEYLNSDRNIINLDILALAETKLTSEVKDEDIESVMTNWQMVKRYDAPDSKEHMGLLLLIPKSKAPKILPFIQSFTELTLKKDANKLQCQGMRLKFQGDDGVDIGFLYCRTSPTVKECEAIVRKFNQCHFVLGDINLSPNHADDKRKLDIICADNKCLALNEITRLASSRQLDHVIIDKRFTDKCFSTSYVNYISDHKTICVRFNFSSTFHQQFLQRTTFDEEHHQKPVSQNDVIPEAVQDVAVAHPKAKKRKSETKNATEQTNPRKLRRKEAAPTKEANAPSDAEFRRSFDNPDATSCWLNACLQLILAAFDHSTAVLDLQSPLGRELLSLHRSEGINMNPLMIKSIMMSQEKERIQQNPEAQFLNLDDGREQCTRDFFISLTENLEGWPDVFSLFCFQIVEETKCGNSKCKHINSTEQVINILFTFILKIFLSGTKTLCRAGCTPTWKRSQLLC